MNTISKTHFSFEHTDESKVIKIINKFDSKKSTGVDKISVKLLKAGKEALVTPITKFVNKSIDSCIFPDQLKRAQVTPIFKKKDHLDKSNYRPVSILPIPSKIV